LSFERSHFKFEKRGYKESAKNKYMEKQLKPSYEDYCSIINLASEIIIKVDSEDRWTYLNEGASQFWGTSRDELLGIKFTNYLHPEDAEKTVNRIQEMIENKKMVKGLINRQKTPKGWRTVEWNAAPLFDEAGKYVGFQATGRDITERKQYEGQLKALHNFGTRLDMANSLKTVVEETMRTVDNLLGFKIGGFAIVDENRLRFVKFHGTSSTVDELSLDGGGITVRAVNTGESQLVPDTRLDPDYVSGRVEDEPDTLSELAVPVIIDGKVVAIINLEKSKVGGFTIEDKQLVETMAMHISSTISRIRYEQKLKGLHRHSFQLVKAEDLDEVYNITYDVLEDILNFPIIDIIIVKKGMLIDKFSMDKKDDPVSIPVSGPGITARAARTGKPQLVNDTRLDEDYVKGARGWTALSELAVPVKVEDEVSAVLNMESHEANAFSEQDQNLVEILAQNIGSTIVNIKQKRALIESLEEVERSNRELEDYTYVVSHDLKAPLRSISAFSSFLNEEYRNKLDEVGQDYLDRIMNAADRMRGLIQDLLVLSRVGRKYTEKDLVDLNELIEEIKVDLEAQLKEGGGKIIADKLPVIRVQKVWMSQVFRNLITNGLKFNESSIPKVEIKFEEREEDYLFSIKDNGIGIRKEDQKKLFKLFRRLHTQEEYEGTGAGLTIVKKIIEINGGEIWLDSELDVGTTFYFTYPKNGRK